jgi:hypothetical protein
MHCVMEVTEEVTHQVSDQANNEIIILYWSNLLCTEVQCIHKAIYM